MYVHLARFSKGESATRARACKQPLQTIITTITIRDHTGHSTTGHNTGPLTMSTKYKQQKALIKSLERQTQQLESTHSVLLQQHQGLSLRHQLLSAYCEGLAVVKDHVSEFPGTNPSGKLQQLLKDEDILLSKLSSSSTTVSTSSGEPSTTDPNSTLEASVSTQQQQPPCQVANCSSTCEPVTLAPASDPMAFFLHTIRQPCMPEAESMSAGDLASMLRDITMQLSVQLHVLESLPLPKQGPTRSRMRELWDRWVCQERQVI